MNKIMSKNNPPIYKEEYSLFLSYYTLNQITDEITDFANKHGVDPNTVRICMPHWAQDPIYLELERPETEKEKEKRLKQEEKKKKQKKQQAEETKKRELELYNKLKAKYGQ